MDKPKESDANKASQVLAAGLDGEWFSIHYGNVMPGRYQRWLPMPPPIPEQKSDVDLAWNKVFGTAGLDHSRYSPKELFESGFNHGKEAAKKGGGA